MTRTTAILLFAMSVVACSDSLTATSPAAEPSIGTISTASTASAAATPINTDEDYYCTSTVTGSFKNVFVPERASCTLTAAQVSGNILAEDGARLSVLETVTDGNIDGVEAAFVEVRGGRLGGSIQVQDGRNPGRAGVLIHRGTVLTQGNITIQKMLAGSITITDARLLKGNIQVQENTVDARLELRGNRVAQNLEVFTTNGSGPKFVTQNVVGQKLTCKENRAPFTGSPNQAGEYEEQCSR